MNDRVAPAVRVLTVAHLRDPAADPPATRCGQPMPPEELWLPVSVAACSHTCQACQTGTVLVQDMLL